MPTEWNLHYQDWVIEDGNPDREVGETFDWFSLEFWSDSPLVLTGEDQPHGAVATDDFKYRVAAEVVYVSEKAAVIDFGIRAISDRDRLPNGCKPGDSVAGEITIGVPLCTPLVPDEILKTVARKWHVNRISADLTPYVPLPDNPRSFVRDSSRIKYEEVKATYSVKAPTYVLHCSEVV
jgi:hypothetical protein